jgi:hypothetical protein
METETFEAHEGISASGHISDHKKFVLSILKSIGMPSTSGQLVAFALSKYPTLTHTQLASFHKRLPELAKKSIVRKQTTTYNTVAVTRCPVTGKMACVWELIS